MNAILSKARQGHPGLYGFAVAMAALAVALVILSIVDDRTVLGQPLWLKPLKFAISFVAYAGTLAWMLGQLPTPALRRTGWVIVATSLIEMIIITGQAARGVRSHFNLDEGVLDAVLFEIMGGTIAVLYVGTIIVAARFLRTPEVNPSHALAIRLGLLLSVLGMSVGIIMVIAGAHAIGVPDGGPGLPLVAWSTTGGDLRIAHFVGLHGLQLLPLVAAVLLVLADRLGPGGRLDGRARLHLVGLVAGAWAGLIVLLTWQALRAQPLLAPDILTGGAAAGLALGCIFGGWLILRAATQRALLMSAAGR